MPIKQHNSIKYRYGFSLIELMIVVAIIGILTSIAIPSYEGYTKKARFVELMTATQPFKIAIALALQQGIPSTELTNGKFGIPDALASTNNVESIKVENGVITAVASKLINNVTYILKPNNTGTTWTIHGTCVNAGLCES